MSNSPSQQSTSISTDTARPAAPAPQRNRHLAAIPERSIGDRKSDEREAREAQHQDLIEATFDRAEAYARLSDFEHAVAWLDRAATLGGDLPPIYQQKRARWDRAPLRAGRAVGR